VNQQIHYQQEVNLVLQVEDSYDFFVFSKEGKEIIDYREDQEARNIHFSFLNITYIDVNYECSKEAKGKM
jgi:hypothetical protein